MIKRNRLIYIFVAVVAALAICAGIVFGLKGARLSYDWNGGSQLQIVCEDIEQAKEVQTKVKSIVEESKISLNSVKTYTNGVQEVVEFTTKSKNINTDVNNAIITEVTTIGATTEGFVRTYSAHNTAAWIVPVTVVALCLAGVIVAYFLTRKLSNMLAYIIGYTAVVILELSLLVLTRVEIGTEAVVTCFVGLVIYTALAIILLAAVRTAQNSAKHENNSMYEIVKDVRNTSLTRLAILYVAIMLISIVVVAVGSKDVMYFGICLILSLVAALYAAYVILLETKAELDISFDKQYANKMTKKEPVAEQTPAQESSKQQKSQTNIKTQQKVAIKKRKRRNRSNNNKVVV